MADGKGLLEDWFNGLTGKTEDAKVNIRRSDCVKESIENARLWQALTGQPVKIAISNIGEGLDHAQAVAIQGEKSIPLTAHDWDMKRNTPKVQPWDWHYPDKKPYRYVDVLDFMKEQEKNIDPAFFKYLTGIK